MSCVRSAGSIEKKNGSMSVLESAICRSRILGGGTGFVTYANFGQPELV